MRLTTHPRMAPTPEADRDTHRRETATMYARIALDLLMFAAIGLGVAWAAHLAIG